MSATTSGAARHADTHALVPPIGLHDAVDRLLRQGDGVTVVASRRTERAFSANGRPATERVDEQLELRRESPRTEHARVRGDAARLQQRLVRWAGLLGSSADAYSFASELAWPLLLRVGVVVLGS